MRIDAIVDRLICALARAKGVPEEAERVAWGLVPLREMRQNPETSLYKIEGLPRCPTCAN